MQTQADVIVVGAGFAGLTAAQELCGHGLDVLVAEAKDRVGGRVKAATLAGRTIDLGGQWVGARHSRLQAEAQRRGIGAYKQHVAGRTVLGLAGKTSIFTGELPPLPPLALIEFAWLQRRWERDAASLPVGAPWAAPKAEEWDGQTLESWIARHLRTRQARAFARLVPRGAWAVEAREVSYLWFLDSLRGGEGLAQLMGVADGILDAKFMGGMHQIAARMAADLGERVVLEAPVSRVAQDETGVRVSTAKGELGARFLIIAAPPAALEGIAFTPRLGAAREGLNARTPMGAIIKLAVAYETPFWREAGFSGQVVSDDDVLGVVMDDTQEGGPGVLLAFFEGPRALEWSARGKAARREAAISRLAAWFGDKALNPIGYEDNDWTAEPWTRGYVGVMGPGTLTRHGRTLREPIGRIHWAGTETSVEWPGYIEGAMRSGMAAAQAVLARHNAG